MTMTPERAIQKRNEAAARVLRLEDQLYAAQQALRVTERKAWASIGPEDTILMGMVEWTYRPKA